MHIVQRVVFENLECLQHFGLPRSMASNAELMANTNGELSSERHASWSNWQIQIFKVGTNKLAACTTALSCNLWHTS